MRVSKILIRVPFPDWLRAKTVFVLLFNLISLAVMIPAIISRFISLVRLQISAMRISYVIIRPVIFSDSSQPVNGVPIVSWQWNFGDGNSITEPREIQSSIFMHSRVLIILSLTVTDSNGCKATAKQTVTQVFIYGAKANFIWKPTTITPGFPITFYNTSVKNTGVTYLWRFSGDGSTSTNPDSVVHIFPNIGTDTVTLIAYPTMAGTCIDTLVQPLMIQSISAPFIDSSYYYNNSSCPPLFVNFTAFPVNTTGLHWDFGDGKGTADNKITPKYQYDIPGTYIVSLTGYGANGISVISYDTITVKGPFAKLYTPLIPGLCPGCRYPACNSELCRIIYLGFWRRNCVDNTGFHRSTYICLARIVYTSPDPYRFNRMSVVL